ncbi:hypothetical protein SSX86_027070 [Deinandra increscens subsp. villosa]|uniref:ATP-dependent DNA helicase n=1 Tax=Deinandra increscens subsp. villosa TaxID=3103831 RepID=A0AAP0CJB0_9ASTR
MLPESSQRVSKDPNVRGKIISFGAESSQRVSEDTNIRGKIISFGAAPAARASAVSEESSSAFVLTGYTSPVVPRVRTRKRSATVSDATTSYAVSHASSSDHRTSAAAGFPSTSGTAGAFVLAGYTQPAKRRRGRPRRSNLYAPQEQQVRRPPAHQDDYRDLGDCDQTCEFCGAAFWFLERLKSFPLSERPRYNVCCRSGRVKMPYPIPPPQGIKRLYEDRTFLSSIRGYNSMFAMTSFGAKVDDTVNEGSGPYVFKVSGQVCHRLGSLCPTGPEKPRFLQLYIYDTMNEVSNRLSAMSKKGPADFDGRIIQILIDTLNRHNELIKLFRTARDVCQGSNVNDFGVRLYQGIAKHPYEAPRADTIGAIIYDGDPNATDFDIIVRDRSDKPQRVNNLHPCYMSLHYPLLFPYGEQGWSPTLTLTGGTSEDDKRLSMNMFYAYQIHERPPAYTLLLNSGRLFQQYLVDAYIAIERNRLEYILSHQSTLRSEFLSGIHDAVSRGDTEGRHIGRRILLPSSFTGGPRYMYKHYQDALAICRVHGNPQYFITFTCNVNWPEIKRYMKSKPLLTPQDLPDVIARVFHMKVNAFIAFLKEEKPFGDVAADLYTIEFQKRGLPHCHTLLWVTDPFRITTPEQVDQHICAEIPDEATDPVLYAIITETMIHGPCGGANVSAPCMYNGSCSKNYPMKHEPVTRFDQKGRVYYKRQADGPTVCKNKFLVDNRYVVPYNKKLCRRFHAHINVEYCGWSMLIKYLFKYISKGTDRIKYSVSAATGDSREASHEEAPIIDEVKNFVDGRFICSHEAAWRILNFHIHCRHPAVQALAVHLEGKQNVTFHDDNLLEQVIDNHFSSKTTLTEWLRSNRMDPAGRHLRYIDYLSEYKWVSDGKKWERRVTKRQPAVGRVVYIHPASGELFFLRMLLNHQPGCRSFSDIRTVGGVVMPTYRAACEKLGLIGNDKEWELALEDACAWANAVELRQLFAHVLVFCEVSNPLQLWMKFWNFMSDDFTRSMAAAAGVDENCIPDAALQEAILYELQKLLTSSSSSATLAELGLPEPQGEYVRLLDNRLLMEELCYDRDALAVENSKMRSVMHPKQAEIYDIVMHSLAENTQALLFVYGHGGTGKTFLWKAITSAFRSIGKVVLTVAASGIAALLLPSGRTAHSRFKIPTKLTEEALCNVKKNTKVSELLLQTSLIIWDEAPMSDRRCFEALDRTLRDIFDQPTVPFGGRSVLLGGDFRQTLPVKKGASKSTIISLSLPRSKLWSEFRVFRLTENMRLHRNGMSAKEREEVQSFSGWMLSVGDGTLGQNVDAEGTDTKDIVIPPQYVIPYSDDALLQLISFIYDEDTLNCPTTTNLHDKAIVCPKNETADHINQMILRMTPGALRTDLSTDSVSPRTHDGNDTELLYPIEYLNGLVFPSLPPHQLDLKINTPVMLIRNLNPSAGLCNGTRLIVTQLLPRLIEAKIITGNCIASSTMTDEHRISSIKPAKAPVPIQGDAIQAIIEQIEDARAPDKIKLMSCYRVEQYNCIPAPGIYKVALHSAAIRIDATTPFVLITDDGGIPSAYYNFVSFETMMLRANLNKVLTDFMGMVCSIEFGEPERKTPRLKLNMEESSGKPIQVALWPEIAEMLDVDMLLDSNYKLIIAFSSVRVTRYYGGTQLESTSATRIEVEPELDAARALRVMYHSRNPVEDITDVNSQKIQIAAGPSEKNRVPISYLLERQLHEHKGIAYTCGAAITAFTPGQSWRYGTCPICNVTMDPQENSYVCTKHREQEPNYKYCVKCDISDGSGTVSVTIFDQPMAQLLGVSCNDIVRLQGNISRVTIPEPIEALKNEQKIYQLNNVSRDSNGNLRFAVNRIHKAEVGTKRTLEQSSSSSQAAGKKALVVHTDPAPQPTVETIKDKALDTPEKTPGKIAAEAKKTPAEKTEHPVSATAGTSKTALDASARSGPMKQLFKDKGQFTNINIHQVTHKAYPDYMFDADGSCSTEQTKE